MKRSDDIQDLMTALMNLQADVQSAPKTAQNPYFHSKYADLESVRAALQPVLKKHGLAFTQECVGEWGLAALLYHAPSGQWIEYDPVKIPVKVMMSKEEKGAGQTKPVEGSHDPQAVKSGFTYFRRLQLCAIFGLAEAEDDAETANGRPAHPSQRTGKPNAAPPPPQADTSDLRTLFARIGNAKMQTELNEIAKEIKKAVMSDDERSALRDAWKKKKDDLAAPSDAEVVFNDWKLTIAECNDRDLLESSLKKINASDILTADGKELLARMVAKRAEKLKDSK